MSQLMLYYEPGQFDATRTLLGALTESCHHMYSDAPWPAKPLQRLMPLERVREQIIGQVSEMNYEDLSCVNAMVVALCYDVDTRQAAYDAAYDLDIAIEESVPDWE